MPNNRGQGRRAVSPNVCPVGQPFESVHSLSPASSSIYADRSSPAWPEGNDNQRPTMQHHPTRNLRKPRKHMKHTDHQQFLDAIEELREVQVTFSSKEDAGAFLVRRCAPMDFGPSTRARDKTARYHFYDFESDSGRNHTLSLLATQIQSVTVIKSTFDPASFVTWPTNWFVTRTTWGGFN